MKPRRFCAECGRELPKTSTNVSCQSCLKEAKATYLPTPPQIAAECAKIRQTWAGSDYLRQSKEGQFKLFKMSAEEQHATDAD